MSLDWMPREHGLKNHSRHTEQWWGTEAPCTVYEKRPLKDPKGNVVPGLYSAWIRLNNPGQYNSYTTEMVKGVIAGFENSSTDREVVAVVFTGTGPNAFCTGGNTKEYSEYYSMRPEEYGSYMELFNNMVDSILMCKKPVICRVNGMRVAGGQEIGTATDITVSSDLAIFGQAGPRHGSAPVGGASDFLPWFLSIEDAMWNCVSCEMWSAYKMKAKNLISKALPVLKDDKGNWVRNPQVYTDTYVKDGEIVYGEPKTGEEAKQARAWVNEKLKNNDYDFSLIDAEVDRIVWVFANLFPGCLMKSIDGIRQKKKFWWDQIKNDHRYWLGTNMMGEAFLGFGAFNTKKITGKDTIDFIKNRQLIAEGALVDEAFMEQVLGKPLAK
ncbi:6-oxocyclohex-1-ene-1-carbonyl-CoA hydratase [Syntrophus aciditrophicus]|uniref:6-oxocyclohex-1-ene-1-carbonyl-CoA hydrolase n=1 Tax=Syntrophus aciditrophicus (strain SB) TaxID=56780 RepID=BAMA_SYNAS|nr:6-oxocyclohex-1-ene-1-carbonyl-CoA hydratase [Syntrophus aciditrophicus]Q2LXU2.1 RecName: Full=6-oxocyclohex-1-ene-1-carbonyl-CoA hydrolase; Short=6-OCH-CoA hydrolase; AltName: Full=6-oxocyclohex-1-ene-1-carbonyl-CoA hydratase [Syntrophus aciditrophicus SB]ABC78905.1 enoyl-CoA hydratase/isomerase family protein [Syntrophus aciditrophicus SB]